MGDGGVSQHEAEQRLYAAMRSFEALVSSGMRDRHPALIAAADAVHEARIGAEQTRGR